MAWASLAAAHGRIWASDPRYRLAWYVWPLSASVVAAGLLLTGVPGSPPTGDWSKPYDQSATDMDALRDAAKTDLAARDRLKRLAEAGDPGAQFGYATLFDPYLKYTDTPDLPTAMDWYLKAAKQGHVVAQGNYGFYLYNGGAGVTVDYDKAFPWLLQAAQQGNVMAQFWVGQAYLNGRGTKQDPKLAYQWHRSAADAGNMLAQTEVADAYAEGNGIEQNMGEAIAWFEDAVKQNSQYAEFRLGLIYLNGENGVQRDPAKALQWLSNAANAGSQWAQYYLATMYDQGVFVQKDAQKALEWYRKSADQGYDVAQNAVGIAYWKGTGVAQDLNAARTWFEKAKSNGNKAAVENLKALDAGKADAQPVVADSWQRSSSGSPSTQAAGASPPADADYKTCGNASAENAVPACDRAIASGKFSGGALVTLYTNRGLWRIKDPDAAIADFSEAIRLDPGRGKAFASRGYAYADKGDRDRAIADYDQAIKLDPKDAGSFNNRGLVYANERDYDRAIQDYDQAIQIDPNYLKAYKNRGDAYRRKGDRERATADYQKALTLNPNDAAKKQIDAALYALSSAPASPAASPPPAPKSAETQPSKPAEPQPTKPADAAKGTGDADDDAQTCIEDVEPDADTIASCDAAIASGKFSGERLGDLLFYRGLAREENKDVDGAIADYTESIKVDPTEPKPLFRRGLELANAKGDKDAAAKDFKLALTLSPSASLKRDIEKALAKLEPAPSAAPSPPPAQPQATASTADPKTDPDAQACQKSDQAACGRAIASGKFAGADLSALYRYRAFAITHADKPDIQAALADYAEAIRLDPNGFVPYALRANVYIDKGDYDLAIKDLDRLIELKPRADFYNNRGHALRRKGDLDRAIEDFNQSIKLDPSDPLAYWNRGLAYRDKGDASRAADDYKKALSLNPGKETRKDIEASLAALSKAPAPSAAAPAAQKADAKTDPDYQACRKGTGEEELAACSRVIASDKFSSDFVPLAIRSGLYSGKGEYDLAIKDLDRAIELSPKQAGLFSNRGSAYRKKGQPDRAIADFNQAIALDPNLLLGYWNRGLAYQTKGDSERATADYNKALSLNPDAATKAKIEASLQELQR